MGAVEVSSPVSQPALRMVRDHSSAHASFNDSFPVAVEALDGAIEDGRATPVFIDSFFAAMPDSRHGLDDSNSPTEEAGAGLLDGVLPPDTNRGPGDDCCCWSPSPGCRSRLDGR